MAARFKSTIGLIILIVIGIIGVFYFSVSSAEEDIHMLAERVLQETIRNRGLSCQKQYGTNLFSTRRKED